MSDEPQITTGKPQPHGLSIPEAALFVYADFAQLAKDANISITRLAEIMDDPESQETIQKLRKLKKLEQQRFKEVTEREAILTLREISQTHPDPTERRRAATAILRGPSSHARKPRARQATHTPHAPDHSRRPTGPRAPSAPSCPRGPSAPGAGARRSHEDSGQLPADPHDDFTQPTAPAAPPEPPQEPADADQTASTPDCDAQQPANLPPTTQTSPAAMLRARAGSTTPATSESLTAAPTSNDTS